MPSHFSIGATDLTITHTASNFSARKSLFGQNDYYFRGHLDDIGYIDVNKIAFVINFLDDCRTASIVSLNFAYPISKVDESSYLQLPAVQDSLD